MVDDNLTAGGSDVTTCGLNDWWGVWFTVTPPGDGTYRISTSCLPFTNFNTTIGVFSACGPTNIIACNDDGGACGGAPNFHSEITMNLTGGVPYLIRVSGIQGSRGTFTLLVSTVAVFTPTPTITASPSQTPSPTASPSATVTPSPSPTTVTIVLISIGDDDGRVFGDSVGGMGELSQANLATANAIAVGDNGQAFTGLPGGTTKQAVGVLSFNTALIPPGATLVSARLRVTRGPVYANWPGLGPLLADEVTGTYNAQMLENADYQAPSTLLGVATITVPPNRGNSSENPLSPAGLAALNLVGITQFKLRFTTPTNFDTITDGVGFYSGENSSQAVRPRLIVEYYGAPGPSPTPTPPGAITIDLYSDAGVDGWVAGDWTLPMGLQNDPFNNGAAAISVGDNGAGGPNAIIGGATIQGISILSFDTSIIPAVSTLFSADLTLTRGTLVGDITPLGDIEVDVRTGVFGLMTLENSDFQAPPTVGSVATVPEPPANNLPTTTSLPPIGIAAVNKAGGPDGGLTQVKLHYTTPSDGDLVNDRIGFYSSEATQVSRRPKLTLIYTVP